MRKLLFFVFVSCAPIEYTEQVKQQTRNIIDYQTWERKNPPTAACEVMRRKLITIIYDQGQLIIKLLRR